MDAKGMKMSKSLGNTVDPLKVMETNGADIIRLWALSVDFTEDHRIGDEILKGVADQYRKLRNTFRYLLGALDGFSEEERQEANLPPLERYICWRCLAYLDRKLRQAVVDFDFNTYVRTLTDFCNEDLSAFFFDIRKDCLYCDAKRFGRPAIRDRIRCTCSNGPKLAVGKMMIWAPNGPRCVRCALRCLRPSNQCDARKLWVRDWKRKSPYRLRRQ
jgi:isoleucyl-tRNA synthetase